jgi:nitrate reductase NapD
MDDAPHTRRDAMNGVPPSRRDAATDNAQPSRRDFILGRERDAEPEAHISSLVVHVRPDKLEGTRAALLAMPGVEIPGEAGSKLIVTLETDTEADIVTRLHEVSLLDGVLSAALVFHHFEPAGDLDRPLDQG